MDDLLAATQDPARHQRWDVRFGRIEYLPLVEGEPQRFTYATTVAPGVTIAGTGESLGDRAREGGARWSGLRFWADNRRSLIEAGAGYWRYVPTSDGTRFLTRYDYRPRWGRLGELADRILFRPLFGWATAWSFDRLRLWLEEGVAPERSRDQSLAHASAVAGLAGVWLYQGLVPKLWRVDAAEVAVWRRLGMGEAGARRAVRCRRGRDGGRSGHRDRPPAPKDFPRHRRRHARAGRRRRGHRPLVADPGLQPCVVELGRDRPGGGGGDDRQGPALGAATAAHRPRPPTRCGRPAVTSIYREALGAEFDRLHPKMQWRFGFSSADGVCQVGQGVMEEVWRGRFFTPALPPARFHPPRALSQPGP